MKKIFVLFIILFVVRIGFAQDWNKFLPKTKSQKELTLFDYQNAFKEYEKTFDAINGYYKVNGEKKEVPGYKQFKRWEWYWKQRVNPFTGKFPKKRAIEKLNEYKKANPQLFSQDMANWTQIPLDNFTNWNNNQGLGRVMTIAFHPSNPNIFWVGTSSGGLWKTNDGGQTYFPLTDEIEHEAIGKIIIPNDYETTHTIYILAGNSQEQIPWSGAIDQIYCAIYKSDDDGTTWEKLSIGQTVPDFFSTAAILNPTNFQIDVNNSNILYVRLLYAPSTIYNGWWKSEDGGDTWFRIHHHIGSAFHPINSDIQYDYVLTNNNFHFIKTTDGGLTWSGDVPPDDYSVYDQHKFALSPNEPDSFYLVTGVVWSCGDTKFYKSTDAGNTLTRMNSQACFNLYKNCNYQGTRASGNGAIAVNPNNFNEVYVGGYTTFHTIDGGINWNCGSSAHVDKQFFTFNPLNGVFYECNDGGISKTDPTGITTNLSQSLPITQVYRTGISETNDNEFIFGSQDNGTYHHSSSTSSWRKVANNDGMDCAIDPNNENIQYASDQNLGFFLKTTDKWNTSVNLKPNFPSGFQGQWVTPLELDPINSDIFYILGSNMLVKTTDGGNSFNPISTLHYKSLSVCKSNNNILYACNGNTLKKSIDGGISWVDLTGNLPLQYPNFEKVLAHPNNTNTVWVLNSSDFKSDIFKSNDGGQTWENITRNFPPIYGTAMVLNQQNTTNDEIYVGTIGGGVFVNIDDGNWMPFMNGLTHSPITDMGFYYNSNPLNSKIKVSTYGRALWESNVFSGKVLSTFTSGQGTVDPVYGGTYQLNEVVTITATPSPGWQFDHWEGSATGNANPIQITMDSHKKLTAVFSCLTVNIPDSNFEQALINLGYDNTLDHQVSTCELSSITSLNLNYKNISDLSGIEYCVNLEELLLSHNNLTSIDVSVFPELSRLDISYNNLSNLDLSNNFKIYRLDGNYNTNLTTVTMPQYTLPYSMSYISLNNCNLDSFNLNDIVVNWKIDLSDNNLTFVNIKNGNNTAIDDFLANNNPNLSCIIVDNALWSWNNWGNNIDPNSYFVETVDECNSFTYTPGYNFENYLETHDSNGNNVPMGDANSLGNGIYNDHYVLKSKVMNLTSLDVSNKNIFNIIGINDFVQLQTLNLNDNSLTDLNISRLNLLQELQAENNHLNTLDLSNQQNLVLLNIQDNTITDIDITNNQQLTNINISGNQLSSIDLDNNTSLQNINISNNQIQSIDLSSNSSLLNIIVNDNMLTNLNVQNNNNTNINNFNTLNNPNLTCIFVDDSNYSSQNWTNIDANSHFVETQAECDAILGVDDINNPEINIYPNPTNSIVSIEKPDNIKINKIEIYDVTGKLIKTYKKEVKTIDIQKFSKGVYLIKLLTKDGVYSKQIIKN